MAFNKNTIKTLILTHLQTISNDVKKAFVEGNHIPEDTINTKIAEAIAVAFEQFTQDAEIQINTQTLTAPSQAALANGGGPVTGTITIPQHTGSIT